MTSTIDLKGKPVIQQEPTKQMIELALSVIRGDAASALMLSDLVKEEYEGKVVQLPPVQRITTDTENVRVAVFVDAEYEVDVDDINRRIADWLDGGPTLVLSGVDRIEVYELTPRTNLQEVIETMTIGVETLHTYGGEVDPILRGLDEIAQSPQEESELAAIMGEPQKPNHPMCRSSAVPPTEEATQYMREDGIQLTQKDSLSPRNIP